MPKSVVLPGMPILLATSIKPATPTVELITKRPNVFAALSGSPCSTLLPNTTGEFRLVKALWISSRAGSGTAWL